MHRTIHIAGGRGFRTDFIRNSQGQHDRTASQVLWALDQPQVSCDQSIMPRSHDTYGLSQARRKWRVYADPWEAVRNDPHTMLCAGVLRVLCLLVLRWWGCKFAQPPVSIRFVCGQCIGPSGKYGLGNTRMISHAGTVWACADAIGL